MGVRLGLIFIHRGSERLTFLLEISFFIPLFIFEFSKIKNNAIDLAQSHDKIINQNLQTLCKMLDKA